jgi:SAM-dependent methyltransferase/transcriptional regulator with XRE-family HTH domain
MKEIFSEMTEQSTLPFRLNVCSERAGGHRAVARGAKISESQFYRYLKGQSEIPAEKILSIAAAAQVHPYWLLTGEGAPDVHPIEGFISKDQLVSIDADSLMECIAQADEMDRRYHLQLTPKTKAEFIFALYQGVAYESKQSGKPIKFESSKAIEIYSYLSSVFGEVPKQMILNTVENINKISNSKLPPKEIRSFCNYINSAIKNSYDDPKTRAYYDRIGFSLEEDNRTYLDKVLNEIKKRYLYSDKKLKILDLGCGNGRHLLHFSKDSRLQPTGIDSCDYAQNVCHDLESSGKIPKGCFVKGDIHNLPFEMGTFDIVFSNASIFHSPFILESPYGLNQIFSEMHRVLKSKGTLFIHSRYGIGFEPFPFYQLHNEGSIRQLCHKHKFEMLSFEKFVWNDSIEYIPRVRFNEWFSTHLVKMG